MSLVLYGVPLSPFVRKVDVVLREKGVPFRYETVNILPMPDWFHEISPARRIPVLRDESVGTEGRAGTIPDSSAICAFLERKHPEPPLYPAEAFALGRAMWLEEWADTELSTVVGLRIFRPLLFPRLQGRPPDLESARKGWNEVLPPLLDYLESELGSGDYLVGDTLTIADVAVACQLANVELVAGLPDAARWPKLVAHAQRVRSRESFGRNLALCRKVVPEPVELA